MKTTSFEVSRVETQDGGDAKVEISPRDILYTQPAEPLEGELPVIFHKLDLRYGYAYILLIYIGFFSLYLSTCQWIHNDIFDIIGPFSKFSWSLVFQMAYQGL